MSTFHTPNDRLKNFSIEYTLLLYHAKIHKKNSILFIQYHFAQISIYILYN